MWSITPLHAQKLSSEERSELQMELIQIKQDLNILKAWKNRNQNLEVQLEKAKTYHASLLTKLDEQLDQLEAAEENIERLTLEIREFKLANRNLFEKVVFKVQIQAAKEHHLDRFRGYSPFFTVYPHERLNLYLLGLFYHYQEAKSFSNWLNQKGASTYIVGFKNDKKVRMLYNYTQK